MADPLHEADDWNRQASAADRPGRLPRLADLLAAVKELTIVGAGAEPTTVAVSAVFYPLAGVLFSVLWLVTDRLTAPGGTAFSGAMVLAVAVAVTGGRPLIGAGRTIAALIAPSPSAAVARMHEPVATMAVAAALIVLAAELMCLMALDHLRPLALVCAPLLGRWGMVVLAFGSLASRPDGRRVKFAPALTFRDFGIASTVTFALIFSTGGIIGIALVLVAAVSLIGLRILLHNRLGGASHASLGAACELAQLMPLALLAGF